MTKILITGGSGFIGTTAVDHFTDRGWTVLNADKKPPNVPAQNKYWVDVDLLDRQKTVQVLEEFRPAYVLHLAAETSLDFSGPVDDFYAVNTRGVENLVYAIGRVREVRRTLYASSLLVCRNGYIPKDDSDFCPSNPYGESKVRGEMIVGNDASYRGEWVIARPSSVWGPWFERSYKKFFQLIARGLYFNVEGVGRLVKPISFSGNTAYMCEKLLLADAAKADRRIFYLADYPEVTVRQWADAVRAEVGGRSLPTVPLLPVKMAALGGDFLKSLGWTTFPLTSFRLGNILTGGHYPIEAMREIVGPLPYSLGQGVRITADWMREQGLL